mgnify:CR=1 FL=1
MNDLRFGPFFRLMRSFSARVALAACVTLVSCSRIQEMGNAVAKRTSEDAAATNGSAAPASTSRDVAGPSTVKAFPGAEGFGAAARGGRGGTICRVRTLAHDGPGSLQACFDASGPRTVVFDVSGVIEGPLEIKHGRLTVAGQTSPRGVTVKGGIVCDNVYDPNDCNDVILRHLRLRNGSPDSLRLGGAHDVIVDHCSMAGAEDESIEISRSRNVTIQHSVIAEPRGDHYQWGGVLINYSTVEMPLENITIHHSVWNGVAGRLPEMTCEENDDAKGKSNCSGHVLPIELSNNVLFDVSDPIWFNRCTGNNEGNDCPAGARNFSLRLNVVANVMMRRSSADADAPFAAPVFAHAGNAIYANDNQLFRGTARVAVAGKGNTAAPHPFPAVTYTPAAQLVATLAKTAGAWPRDRMDERLAAYLTRGIDTRPAAWRGGRGVEQGDAVLAPTAAPLPAIKDANGDGIPDDWSSNACKDVGPNGYTPLECYLNELADRRTPH